MRLSTGLFAVGGVLYLTGLYGFTTFLPSYRDSVPVEIEALRKDPAFFNSEDRREEAWKITNRHAQWEAVLHPGFMFLLGAGMVVTGVGAIAYLKERRKRLAEGAAQS